MKTNFLIELMKVLAENNKNVHDIKWVGTKDYLLDIEDFYKHSDFDYDSGYGLEVINTDLLVVGDDWWLERATYDGSEWWEFKTLPVKPKAMLDAKTNIKT